MKYVWYILALALGIAAGFAGGIQKRSYRRLVCAIILLGIGHFLSLFPPIVGTFNDLLGEAQSRGIARLNVLVQTKSIKVEGDTAVLCQDVLGQQERIRLNEKRHITAVMANKKNTIIYTQTTDNKILALNFQPATSIMLPYIPGLGEKARIMFFHVPLAWTGFFAYFVTMIYSIRYLKRKNSIDDTIAYSSAIVGTLFTTLAYVSGALWAKFNWGKFFNWDTRELSVLLLLAIYAAYIALRTSIKEVHDRRRITAVYAIIAAIAAVFLIFIAPRVTASLHPGSRDDVNIGPILSPEIDALDATKAIIFSIMLCAFTLLYTWILNIVVRLEITTLRITQRTSYDRIPQ